MKIELEDVEKELEKLVEEGYLKTKDSGGEKGYIGTKDGKPFMVCGNPPVLDEKLPEPNCEDCKYGDIYHCYYTLHEVGNCTNYDKFEPKEKE